MTAFLPGDDLMTESESSRKLFTLEEANRSLVLVRRIVEDVVFEYGRLLDLQETIEAAQQQQDHPQAESARTRVTHTVDRLHVCMEELDCLGVRLQDWSLGVVDFSCVAGGREVRLCWQYGDERILHWHEVDAGCCGRQDIRTLDVCETVVV